MNGSIGVLSRDRTARIDDMVFAFTEHCEDGGAGTEKLHKALLALAGDTSCRGERLRVTRYWARGNVDYAKVPALKGVDCEAYRKKGGYRFRSGR